MKLGHRLKGHKGHCGLVSIKILDSVLNVKALIGTSKQEKVLVGSRGPSRPMGSFSVIMKTDGSFAAVGENCRDMRIFIVNTCRRYD